MSTQSVNGGKGRTAGRLIRVLTLASVIAFPASAGTIVGKVKFTGTPRPPKTAKIDQDNAVCGSEKQAEYLVVGPDRGVRWAVVRVSDIGGAKSSGATPTIDQKNCDFIPRVVIARPGEETAVLNSDGILHNVHTKSKLNTELNKAQPGFVKKMPLTFTHAEIIRLKCDVHAWMTGWIFVTDSPHAAVTDETGSFTLPDVPAGTHRLSVWHEKLGEQTKSVTVADGETPVSFEFAGD